MYVQFVNVFLSYLSPSNFQDFFLMFCVWVGGWVFIYVGYIKVLHFVIVI